MNGPTRRRCFFWVGIAAAMVGGLAGHMCLPLLSVPPAPSPAPPPAVPPSEAERSPPAAEGVRRGADGGPLFKLAASSPGGQDEERDFSAAAARAYAWVGLEADGYAPGGLDPDSWCLVPDMRGFLTAQPRRSGLGLATITPRGVHAVVGGAGDVCGDADAMQRLSREMALGDCDLAAGRYEERHFELVAQPGRIRRQGERQELSGPGLWAVIRRPVGTPPTTIVAPEAHPYALAIDGEAIDFGEIRLDGGLVVPRRFYAVTGAVRVSGDGPCTVRIRPLSAVTAYHPEPLRPPSADN